MYVFSAMLCRIELSSYLKHFLYLRQVHIAFFCDEGIVLNTNTAAEFGVVEARLICNDMARLKEVRVFRYAGGFVDLQAEPMTGPMKKPLHTSVFLTGFISSAGEQIFNCFMNFLAVDTCLEPGKDLFLSFQNRVIHPFEHIRCGSFDDRAGDVGEIAGFHGFGKHIQNDRRIRRQRSGAGVVRVTPLDTAGHDGMLGDAVPFQQVDVQESFDVFGREWSFRSL